jgi:hypothetical protein
MVKAIGKNNFSALVKVLVQILYSFNGVADLDVDLSITLSCEPDIK